MKKGSIICILILYSLLSCSAGVRERNDSLLTVRKIDSLYHVAEVSRDADIECAEKCANDVLALSQRIKYTKGQANALMFLANCYSIREVYPKTLENYFKIIDIYTQHHDINNVVTSYSYIVALFITIKDYDLAAKYLRIMANIAGKSANPVNQRLIFQTRAEYYIGRHEYDSAIRNLYLCIPTFKKVPDLMLEGRVYKFLGDALLQKKQYSKAGFAYRTAISVYGKVPNPAEITVIYTRIAHIYQVLENHPKNLEYNLMALHLREKIGQSKLIASSYLNVGEAYWLLGKKDLGNMYMKRALKLAEQNNNTFLLEAIYSQLSDFAKEEKKYRDAYTYFETCIKYRKKLNYEQNKSALAIFEANRTIRASEVQNDLLNQENLIQNLQIKNRRIQTFFFEVAFLTLLSLILFVDTLARNTRKRKNKLNELNDRLKQEIHERIEAEGRLRRSEELHRFLAENTVDVISLLDAGLQRLYISPSCEKFYGYTPHEILGMKSLFDLIDPAYHVFVNQRLLEMFRTKNSIRYIYKALRKDGLTFWAEANINPLIDNETNEVKDIISVVRDISERMKHEEALAENSRQLEYLLHEIHNRVKNNFAILISLMNMQRDQTPNPELNRSLSDLQLRVRTMSLVHEQLYQTSEISTIPFGNYLQHLTNIISSSFNNERIRLQTEIHPCELAIEMALPMGLIINELITNAYKYAFPGDKTGTIWVKLLKEEERLYSISICDNGIGLPDDFSMKTTHSMGSQIVGILVEQIEARLEVKSNGGACFRILFSTKPEI